jgi:hypothetical protein
MTSGLPPDAPGLRRAGVFVPPAVASALSLPGFVVFVGTVLLSVVLRCCGMRCGAAGSVRSNWSRRRTPGLGASRRTPFRTNLDRWAPPRNAP